MFDSPSASVALRSVTFALPILVAGGIGFVWQRRNPPATWRIRRRYSDPMGWVLFFITMIQKPLAIFWMVWRENIDLAFRLKSIVTDPEIMLTMLAIVALYLLRSPIQTGIGFTLGAWLALRLRRA